MAQTVFHCNRIHLSLDYRFDVFADNGHRWDSSETFLQEEIITKDEHGYGYKSGGFSAL